MKIFFIICAVIALFDLAVVGSTMKISSRVSRTEETARLKMRFKERENNAETY